MPIIRQSLVLKNYNKISDIRHQAKNIVYITKISMG